MKNRRSFIKTSTFASAAVASLRLPFLSAKEVAFNPQYVSIESGIEPTVRLIETTSRADLIEVMARRVAQGLSYQELLAALFLAGVRNVQPRPNVGFKFHSVLVVHSAHLASLASQDSDRWLPIFWALDYFKATQKEEESTSGWTLKPVDESRVPVASKARDAFVQAMDHWDEEAADAAVASLARTASAHDLFELFCRYGARDFRSIGHKAIYVANSFRTLQCIGWQHAEPVLRSLTLALQNHNGEAVPSQNDLAPDRPWRTHLELQDKIRPNWQDGALNPQASQELIAMMRSASDTAPAQTAIDMVNAGVAPRSIWDAIMISSGELLMQQPGIVALHSLTTANALHHAYITSADDSTRRMLTLQACAFVSLFRKSAEGRAALGTQTFESLKQSDDSSAKANSIEQIFAEIGTDGMTAARRVYRLAEDPVQVSAMMGEARRLVFLKGRDAHDYKFSAAVLEDYHQVSDAFKREFLALSVFNLRGTNDKDNGLVERTRRAIVS